MSYWLADEAIHAGKVSKALAAIEQLRGSRGVRGGKLYASEMDWWVCGLAPKRQRTEESEQPDAEMKPPVQSSHGGKSGGKGKMQ